MTLCYIKVAWHPMSPGYPQTLQLIPVSSNIYVGRFLSGISRDNCRFPKTTLPWIDSFG